MKNTVVFEWCDMPGCAAAAKENQEEEFGGWRSQRVFNVDFWVNVYGGRKSKPIKIVLCEEHANQMKQLHIAMSKYDQLAEMEDE